jgi:hypothetical protein
VNFMYLRTPISISRSLTMPLTSDSIYPSLEPSFYISFRTSSHLDNTPSTSPLPNLEGPCSNKPFGIHLSISRDLSSPLTSDHISPSSEPSVYLPLRTLSPHLESPSATFSFRYVRYISDSLTPLRVPSLYLSLPALSPLIVKPPSVTLFRL